MSKAKSMYSSRPSRPPPSRKSDFLQETPTVIYSQAASDFRPPADYIGPRKSLMRRPPDASMNPSKNSLPVLSVSKLDVPTQVDVQTAVSVHAAVPPSSQISLPRVEQQKSKSKSKATYSSPLLGCEQVQKILCNMPQSFKKLFRSELRHKRPIKGRTTRFVYRDIHDPAHTEQPVLHGIILLGGNHRDMVEEVPVEPGTPPPLSGRVHCVAQTDTYLEDIADNESGFISTEMQCEPIYDEPVEAPPLEFDTENMITTGTQLDQWVFPEIDHAFDQLSTNLADAVIMESLKQLQEEFELEALRKQHEYHKCLRNREMLILAKYKNAQEKYEEQRRILDSRKPWDETLDQIIQLVGFDKIRDIAPLHFIGSQTDQAVFEHIQETMVPPLNTDVEKEYETKKVGRNVLDSIIEETVLKREAEYAGKMYIRDPKKKGSLATESPRESIHFDEWGGELEDDLDVVQDYEIPEYHSEHAVSKTSSLSQKEEIQGEVGDSNYVQEKRESQSTLGFDPDDDDDI